jgi:hypothetical protein
VLPFVERKDSARIMARQDNVMTIYMHKINQLNRLTCWIKERGADKDTEAMSRFFARSGLAGQSV